MYLRELEIKDAPLMYEWMHDPVVTEFLSANFAKMTVEDAERFIEKSNEKADKKENIHKAIASDEDEYMGTVSLKNVNYEELNAEFGISTRSSAHGRGYAWFGMVEILSYGFDELGLQAIYWCVSASNKKAVRFYDKHGFNRIVDIPQSILKNYADRNLDLIWFVVLKGDDFSNRLLSKGEVAGCKVVNIKTIATLNAGELSFFEANRDVPFEFKRVYYISKVPEGARRGFHAHKELKQILFCPYGKIQLILDDGKVREEITLDDPSIGICIDHTVWREMLWMKKNSVLCVMASDYYDENDYIRNYTDFLQFVR